MGLNAEFMSGLADDTARLNQALDDLDAIFAGQASANFVEGFIQDWTAEPYIRGTYSYPAPGSYPNGGPSMRETLAQPVGGELFFAGEATNNTAPSTVPGALQSGERASGEIDVALGGPPAPGAPKADLQALPTSGARRCRSASSTCRAMARRRGAGTSAIQKPRRTSIRSTRTRREASTRSA